MPHDLKFVPALKAKGAFQEEVFHSLNVAVCAKEASKVTANVIMSPIKHVSGIESIRE